MIQPRLTIWASPLRPRWPVMLALGLAAFAAPASSLAQAQPEPPPAPAAPAAPAAPKPLADALSGSAKAEYEAGRILFRIKDYTNAIIKFERAYELSRDPRLLKNVALCEKNLQRYARMLATVEKYLRDGGPMLSAEDRQEAAALIEDIKPYVSELQIQGAVAGATVFVDDAEVGPLPFTAPVRVDVGPRKIRVSKAGYKDFTVTLKVGGGSVVSVPVHLEKELHRGRLIVRAGPQDLIHLDGRMVGRGTWEGFVPSGGHTLRVSAPGKLAQQREVMLQDDQVRRIDVRLTEGDKPGGAPWLWIGGGAALLAGAVVAGVFLFQPEPPVEGNTSPGVVAVSGRGRGLVLRFGGSR